MSNVKHTKNELKAQKDALNRFQRFLPMLLLKKQQLQAEIQRITSEITKRATEEEKQNSALNKWVRIFSEPVEIDSLVSLKSVHVDKGNIAGVEIPVFRDIELEKALSVKGRVCLIKDFASRRGVSYGRSYITPQQTRIAVVPIGYSHGYPYTLSKRSSVLINGVRYPIAGNVCMDYINLRQIDIKKNKVNNMFNETQEQNDLTIRLTEILKTISEEYNQCARRIDQSIQKLNGERAKRVERHNQKNASILNLVELFQDEKERNMMIQIAEMQKQAVEDEAEKFENMSSWKARILGVSKEDAI